MNTLAVGQGVKQRVAEGVERGDQGFVTTFRSLPISVGRQLSVTDNRLAIVSNPINKNPRASIPALLRR
jgi:hypothetical protein